MSCFSCTGPWLDSASGGLCADLVSLPDEGYSCCGETTRKVQHTLALGITGLKYEERYREGVPCGVYMFLVGSLDPVVTKCADTTEHIDWSMYSELRLGEISSFRT